MNPSDFYVLLLNSLTQDDVHVIGDDSIRSPATVELYDFSEPERLDVEQTFRCHEDTFPY